MINVQIEKGLDEIISSAVNKRIVPGIAVAIGNKNRIIFEESYGKRDIMSLEENVNSETMYDIANLTMPIGTSMAIMKLIESGKCSIYDNLGYYYGIENDKKDITVRNLLTHTGGFKDSYKFYQSCTSYYDSINGTLKMSLASKPNTKVIHSDLGFILLGNIIEKITDRKLDEALKELVFDKLDMYYTGYNIEGTTTNIAPTHGTAYGNEYFQGVSQDSNCRFFNGVSGHSGLFSNLDDLMKMALMISNNGMHKGNRFLAENTINLMTNNHTEHLNQSRGLGWSLFDLNEKISSSGELITPGSFGYTGFTGPSIWFDKKRDLYVVILTNSTHPEKEDKGFLRIRQYIHNYVFANY